MTLSVASLIVAAASQAAAAVPARHPVVDFFVSACMDGRVNLGANSREVRRQDLPPVVRRGLGSSDGLRFWELSQPRLYLVVKADRPRDYYRRACSVYAPELDLQQAHDQVWEAMLGELPPRALTPGRPLRYEFSNFAEDYQFVATERASDWVLLQIGHIGEAGRARFEAGARNRPPSTRRRLVK